jgi:uncharacterized protein (TIGR02145 family)
LASGSTNTLATETIAITPIVYTTTGATGVSIDYLPTGVSAVYSLNQVTISGKPSAAGTFNYTVTLIGNCGTIQAMGTIIVDATTPQYAASTQTWSFSSCATPQTWSAPIKIPACSGTAFTNSYDVAYCRDADGYANTGYFYNWAYVKNNASLLCNGNWRIPTLKDFIDLDVCLGGTGENGQAVDGGARYNGDAWGGTYGGHAGDDIIAHQGEMGFYWSSEVRSSVSVYRLYYHQTKVDVQTSGYAFYGFPVRCVR